MNKLDFFNIKLCGRSAELTILKEAYQRVNDAASASSETVLVHGFSGTGKTALIRELQTWIRESDGGGGYFVSGKFSKLRVTEPYSALAEAFNDLCDLILESTDKGATVASFKKAVGHKGKVLLNVVPNLNKLIGDLDGDTDTPNTATALDQLKFVLRAFLRSVCTVAEEPVVLFLDDLQWADAASLELIHTIISDLVLNKILFLGSYRDNEVNDTHPLSVHLREIEREKKIIRIPLGDLDLQTVNELISRLTELNPSSTQPLTDVVYQKTAGNIFFVIQFLRMLQEENLLYFSMTSYRWTWDMGKIRAETDLADNVVDLVAGKIKRLPVNAQAVLKFAACLWSTFDAKLLQEIMVKGTERYQSDELKSTSCIVFHSEPDECERSECNIGAGDDLAELLDIAAAEGLLDKLSGTRYKFAHDRIQQAAYSLLEEGRATDRLHHLIGDLLWQMIESPRREEWMYFAAVDQLNIGCAVIFKEDELIELARRNLQVGEKAIKLSAFVPAASYLKTGIGLLPRERRWTQYYSLCIRLHNSLADVEHCTGNSEGTQVVVEEVLANAKSYQDKIDSLYTLGLSLFSQAKQHDLILLCYKVLQKLGEHLPKRARKLVISLECKKLRRMLGRRSDTELMSLPTMEDREKIAAMKFYLLMHSCSQHLGKMRLAWLIAMKMVKLSLVYGICELTPNAFAAWGEVLVGTGDIKEAYHFGKLAVKMVNKHVFDPMKARVRGFVHCFLDHWQEPLQQSLDPILQAHKTGLVNGDTTWAFQTILGYQSTYFFSGMPLSSGVEDLMAFSRQMQEYGQKMTRRAQLPLLQYMLNLMGRSENVLHLTGEVMDQEEFERLETNPNQIGVQAIASCRMQLAYYFDDLELAAELSRKLESISKNEVFAASYLVCVRTMFFGLISVALARKTKKRKHAAKAAKIIKYMEKRWVKNGALNCLHKLLLLKAEYASLESRQKDVVKVAYDEAISTTRRIGFIQDEALANEKAGLFFLKGGDEFWASSYLSRARDLYSEWGAQAKTEQLEKRYGSLLKADNEEHYASHVRGRPRFTESVSKSHKMLRKNRLLP